MRRPEIDAPEDDGLVVVGIVSGSGQCTAVRTTLADLKAHRRVGAWNNRVHQRYWLGARVTDSALVDAMRTVTEGLCSLLILAAVPCVRAHRLAFGGLATGPRGRVAALLLKSISTPCALKQVGLSACTRAHTRRDRKLRSDLCTVRVQRAQR